MMKYTAQLRENDFDLFLYDSNQTLVFYTTRVSYSDVSSLFIDGPCKHYLVFSTMSGFVTVNVDLPVQDHMDLLESLRIFND